MSRRCSASASSILRFLQKGSLRVSALSIHWDVHRVATESRLRLLLGAAAAWLWVYADRRIVRKTGAGLRCGGVTATLQIGTLTTTALAKSTEADYRSPKTMSFDQSMRSDIPNPSFTHQQSNQLLQAYAGLAASSAIRLRTCEGCEGIEIKSK